MTLIIQSERLNLRRFTPADGQDLLDFVSHPTVARATPEIKATESGVQEYIHRQNEVLPFEQDKCFDLAIEHRPSGRVIGLLTLVTRENQIGEIGWALDIHYRGRGYATEAASALIQYAFSSLGLHRIQTSTSSENPKSVAVMQRLGMRREALLLESELRDGRWVDGLIYGLLAGDQLLAT